MATTYVSYTSGGTDFTFPFSYISSSHITVKVNSVITTGWTLPSANLARLDATTTQPVRIERNTPDTSPLVDFTGASSLPPQDLDTNFDQLINVIQEKVDELSEAGSTVLTIGALTTLMHDNHEVVSAVQSAPTWTPSTNYRVGQRVTPSTLNNYVYECRVTGTSHTSEPAWGTTVGGNTGDNTVTWICLSAGFPPHEIDVSALSFGAKFDGVTDDTAAIQAAITCATTCGGTVSFPGGTAILTSALEATGTLRMNGVGKDFTILHMSAAPSYVLRCSGKCYIEGLTLDGGGFVTEEILHCTNIFPTLTDVALRDSLGRGLSGGTDYASDTNHNVYGDACLTRVDAIDCVDIGFQLRGASRWEAAHTHVVGERVMPDTGAFTGFAYECTVGGITAAAEPTPWPTTLGGTIVDGGVTWKAVETSTVSMIDCRTLGTTGSGDFAGSGRGYLMHCRGHSSVRIVGGEFTGDATASNTCALTCESAEITGGYWHDIYRGPTVGIRTQRFSVVGNSVAECSNIGIALDTTDGIGETDSQGGVVSGNSIYGCGRGIRSTCSNLVISGNSLADCTDTTGWIAVAGEGTHVVVEGNCLVATGVSTTFTAVLVTENSHAIVRNNVTNTATIIGYQATLATTSTMTECEVRSVSADCDARCRDEIIAVDATLGGCTIALPEATNRDLIGHQIEVFRTAGVNQILISVRSADGTINGATNISLPLELYSRAICRNLGGADWAVTILRPDVNPTFFTLTALATTPNVKNMTHFWASAAAPLTITRFDNGALGQVITVVATNANTTLKHGATIINRSAGDYTMAASSARRYICIDATNPVLCVWTEI